MPRVQFDHHLGMGNASLGGVAHAKVTNPTLFLPLGNLWDL